MKKLLFALVLTGFWFNASKSTLTEDELREKAKRAIEHNVARFKSEQMTGYYENEFRVSNKQQTAQMSKIMRDVRDLAAQTPKIDDKNGASVLELSRKVVEAQETLGKAVNDLQMHLGPTKSQVQSPKDSCGI